MANFGARLAYPLPDHVVAYRERAHALRVQRAAARPSIVTRITELTESALRLFAQPWRMAA
jgi:hypothetical protein